MSNVEFDQDMLNVTPMTDDYKVVKIYRDVDLPPNSAINIARHRNAAVIHIEAQKAILAAADEYA